MKKKFLFPLLAVLAITTLTVVGCSKDDDLDEFDTNLDIDYNTRATRSVAEDVFVGDPSQQRANYYRYNTQYDKVQAGCAITMLVDIWIKDKGRAYFEVPPTECPQNAQQKANELLMSFSDSYDEETGIPTSAIVNVANGGNSDGSFSSKIFSSEGEKVDFFSKVSNRQKIRGIQLQNEKTHEAHSAAASSVTSTSVYFTGFDIFNPDKNRYGSYTMPVSGTKQAKHKDGSDAGSWRITGVYLN